MLTIQRQVADKVHEYVNRRTQTGSHDAHVQSIVRCAVITSATYIELDRDGQADESMENEANKAVADAAKATDGELDEMDIVWAAVVSLDEN